MKYGIEAEGRLRGLPTLFMSAREAADLLHGNTSLRSYFHDNDVTPFEVRHWYISDPECFFTAAFAQVCQAPQWRSHIFTIEVPKLSAHRVAYPNNVNFMLAIPADDNGFWNAQLLDQVKFTDSSLNVRSVCLAAMDYTSGTAFLNDVEAPKNPYSPGTPK